MLLALMLLLSYLSGSIPFALLLGFAAGTDIRRHGSKNIGATNALRVCGPKWGVPALLLDAFKGALPVLFLPGLLVPVLAPPWPAILCAVAAVLGHNFPVWLGFRGGKGVATSAGAFAGLMWQPFLVALAAFVATVAIWRYISLGSMVGSVVLVVAALAFLPSPLGANLPLTAAAVLLAILLIARHRANISRILAGTENRFPPPKAKPAEPETVHE